MIVTKVSETAIKENIHKVDARKIFDTENMQLVHIHLNPGEALKPHITPVDVVFYILEGQPDVLIGNEKSRVSINMLIESPKNIVHCIYNDSDQPARILAVKSPRPETKSIIV